MHKLCVFFIWLITIPIVHAVQPSFMYTPLTKKEMALHFGSNNPIKKLVFDHRYKAYKISITNPLNDEIVIQSKSIIPTPLSPLQVEQSLQQSMSAAPWLIGAGWTCLLTGCLGFALIPSIVFGGTLIIAGIIGMQNNHLPSVTQHTIKHVLIDGIHDYIIPAHDHVNLLIILPATISSLQLTYNSNNKNIDSTITLK